MNDNHKLKSIQQTNNNLKNYKILYPKKKKNY